MITKAEFVLLLLASFMLAPSVSRASEVEEYRNFLRIYKITGTHYLDEFLDQRSSSQREELFARLRHTGSTPAFISTYSVQTPSGTRRRHLFLLRPQFLGFPGNNSETAVVTDESNHLLFWSDIGVANTYMVTAEIFKWRAGPVLELVRKVRGGWGRKLKIYCYSLSNHGISLIEEA
jgi:hypothetical protein